MCVCVCVEVSEAGSFPRSVQSSKVGPEQVGRSGRPEIPENPVWPLTRDKRSESTSLWNVCSGCLWMWHLKLGSDISGMNWPDFGDMWCHKGQRLNTLTSWYSAQELKSRNSTGAEENNRRRDSALDQTIDQSGCWRTSCSRVTRAATVDRLVAHESIKMFTIKIINQCECFWFLSEDRNVQVNNSEPLDWWNCVLQRKQADHIILTASTEPEPQCAAVQRTLCVNQILSDESDLMMRSHDCMNNVETRQMREVSVCYPACRRAQSR